MDTRCAQQAGSFLQVLADVQDALEALDIDECDRDDVQEIVDLARAELEHASPNAARLGSYLNSLARSLRTQPQIRTVVLELDAVMRDAHLPTTWEH